MVKEGRKLIMLDDLILDVGWYADYHPGGAFVINHNIGREVDKYFYGGYALEEGMLGWNHSNVSRKIVNSLAIGIIEQHAEIFLTKLDHEKTIIINNDTRTLTF